MSGVGRVSFIETLRFSGLLDADSVGRTLCVMKKLKLTCSYWQCSSGYNLNSFPHLTGLNRRYR